MWKERARKRYKSKWVCKKHSKTKKQTKGPVWISKPWINSWEQKWRSIGTLRKWMNRSPSRRSSNESSSKRNERPITMNSKKFKNPNRTNGRMTKTKIYSSDQFEYFSKLMTKNKDRKYPMGSFSWYESEPPSLFNESHYNETPVERLHAKLCWYFRFLSLTISLCV